MINEITIYLSTLTSSNISKMIEFHMDNVNDGPIDSNMTNEVNLTMDDFNDTDDDDDDDDGDDGDDDDSGNDGNSNDEMKISSIAATNPPHNIDESKTLRTVEM